VVRPGALFVVLVTGVVSYEFSRSREETGLTGSSGDTLVMGLREQLQRQGELPALPAQWRAEAVLRPAGGGPFAGDFVVSALTDADQFELTLVDVSGKGVDAGTRALLLSGALGGLLGSLRPQDYLPAANRYLHRQEWVEGFATAVHLVLDLSSGAFAVESAGHPPVASFDAGTGRWRLLTCEGMALGLVPEVSYVAETGRLDPGDALLLYTDGLVEVPGRELSVGIDKLLGEAERLVPGGFAGGGERLVTRVAEASTDDRGLVLLWRVS
jgi:serine phosphatase RsbU (regulator of sigma subunit)